MTIFLKINDKNFGFTDKHYFFAIVVFRQGFFRFCCTASLEKIQT